MELLTKCVMICLALLAVGENVFGQTAVQSIQSYDPDLVVAKVGTYDITLRDMRRAVERREMYSGAPGEDSTRRLELLESLIEEQLVRLEASRITLDRQYSALARIRRAVTMRAAALYARDVLSAQYVVDSVTIDTFYANHITRYSTPRDQRRIRVISVWKEGKRPGEGMVEYHDSLYQGWYPEDKIDSLYIRLASGENFASLAMAHSEDPRSRSRGGDLGWVSAQSLGSSEFSGIVMSQPLHMISKPIETDDAYHIVQVVGERPTGPVPLDDEIRADIVENLIRRQQDAMVRRIGDSLVAAAKVKWFEENEWLDHEELRGDMILFIVNNRDTLFAEEYIVEVSKWLDQRTLEYPDPVKRNDILRADHLRHLCWYGFLRELGFTDRPEVVALREESSLSEREALIRQRREPGAIPEPDSTAIRSHYEANARLYGNDAGALSRAWNSIKAKLVADARSEAHRRWLRSAESKHGVTRYLERLEQLPFLNRQPRKS